MISWKKFYKSIPNKVHVGENDYEVLWVNGFHKDDRQLGESRFGDTKQIIIDLNQPIKEAVHTYFHEFLHIVSLEYDVNLTETQVMAMEKSLKHFIEAGNLFKKEESNGTKQRNSTNKGKRSNFKRLRQTCTKAR